MNTLSLQVLLSHTYRLSFCLGLAWAWQSDNKGQEEGKVLQGKHNSSQCIIGKGCR